MAILLWRRFWGKSEALSEISIFLFFRRARIFEVDFRSPQGGAKVAYIKAFGRFLDFGIENRVRFWGAQAVAF